MSGGYLLSDPLILPGELKLESVYVIKELLEAGAQMKAEIIEVAEEDYMKIPRQSLISYAELLSVFTAWRLGLTCISNEPAFHREAARYNVKCLYAKELNKC